MSTEVKNVNVEKKEKVVSKATTPKKEYVRFRQMKQVDIDLLPRYQANVTKTKSRRGNWFYQLSVRFHRLLTVNIPLSETEYNLIVLLRKIQENRPINTIDVWGRLLEGPNKDGQKWQRWELFVCRDVFFGEMFDNQQRTLIDVAGIKLPFEEISTELETVDEFDEESLEDYKRRVAEIF